MQAHVVRTRQERVEVDDLYAVLVNELAVGIQFRRNDPHPHGDSAHCQAATDPSQPDDTQGASA